MTKTPAEVKKTLQDITHKTINELYLKFEFIMPQLYEAAFGRRMADLNVKLSKYNVEEELKRLLSEIEVKSAENEKNFAKLLDYSGRALSAIDKENKTELQLIHKQTSKFVVQIQELEQKAYYDDITGLLNRNGFHKEVCGINNKSKFSGSMFFIDLDNFKYINDSYGHHCGNTVLKTFAGLLSKQLINIPQNQRFISRVGGDEFLIAVNEENAAYTSNELKRVQDNSYEFLIDGDNHEPISFSFGEAVFTKNTPLEKVVMMADKEMYRNKRDRKEKRLIEGI